MPEEDALIEEMLIQKSILAELLAEVRKKNEKGNNGDLEKFFERG